MKKEIAKPIYVAYKKLLDKLISLAYSNTKGNNDIAITIDDEVERNLFFKLQNTHKAIKIRDSDDSRKDFASILSKSSPNTFIFDVIDMPKIDRLNEEVQIYFGEKNFMDFEGAMFWIKTTAGKNYSINFYPTRGGTSDTLVLMHAIVDLAKSTGIINDNYLNATLTIDSLKTYIKATYPGINVTNWGAWLKSTKGNLEKKIDNQMGELIKIGNFNRTKGGYPVSFKIPY